VFEPVAEAICSVFLPAMLQATEAECQRELTTVSVRKAGQGLPDPIQLPSRTPRIFSISETFKRLKRQTATGRDKCTLLIKKTLLGIIDDIHNPAVGILLMSMRFIENDLIAKKWLYFVYFFASFVLLVYFVSLVSTQLSTLSTLSSSVVFKTQ
jgi:hypothetical protein